VRIKKIQTLRVLGNLIPFLSWIKWRKINSFCIFIVFHLRNSFSSFLCGSQGSFRRRTINFQNHNLFELKRRREKNFIAISYQARIVWKGIFINDQEFITSDLKKIEFEPQKSDSLTFPLHYFFFERTFIKERLSLFFHIEAGQEINGFSE